MTKFLFTKQGQYLLPTCLMLMTLFVYYFVFGFYFEAHELVNTQILYGTVMESPWDMWINEDLFLQIPILAYLSSIFPSTPVYGIWHTIVMGIHVWLWFFLCTRLIGRLNGSIAWKLAAVILFVWMIEGTSLVYLNFTRDSLLLASASLLIYLDYYLADGKKHVGFLVFFILGCSMRVPSAFFVLLVISLMYVWYVRNPRRVLGMLAIPWLLMSIFMGLVLMDKTSGNVGREIEQNSEYALCHRLAIRPMSDMTTAEDSMRYRGLTEYFLVMDSAQITLDFIDRVVDHDKFNMQGISQNDFEHLKEVYEPWLDIHKWELIICYLGLLLLAYKRPKRIWYGLGVVHAFAWLIVIAIAMKINMYEYFLDPWLGMLFAMSYFFLFQDGFPGLLRWQKAVAVIFPLLVCASLSVFLYGIAKQERADKIQSNMYLQRLEEFSQMAEDAIIWSDHGDYMPTDVFSRRETDVLKKYHYMCTYFLAHYNFAQKRCIDRLGFSPLDWRTMNHKLNARKDSLYILTKERTAEFLRDYYRTLYDMEFNLRRDSTQQEILPKVFVYKLYAENDTL